MILNHRTVISISGEERFSFLQSLVTNDIKQGFSGTIYAHMLTPQGKFLYDIFVYNHREKILLDVYRKTADELLKKLNMYKLRSDVTIKDETDNFKVKVTGVADPRSNKLNREIIVKRRFRHDQADIYTKARIEAGIPEGHIDIISGEDFPLYYNLEDINGVSFTKGCYVGQEVTARMKHKTELKKKVVTISGESLEFGQQINADGKKVGKVLSVHENIALALLDSSYLNVNLDANGRSITITR